MNEQWKKLFESKDNGKAAPMLSLPEIVAERPTWGRSEVNGYIMYATGRLNARYANLSDAGKDEHQEGLALESRTR
jgi:hypothetical protein